MDQTSNAKKNAFLSKEGGEVQGVMRMWERLSTCLGRAQKGLWKKIWRVSNSGKEMLLIHKASLLEGLLRQRKCRSRSKIEQNYNCREAITLHLWFMIFFGNQTEIKLIE